MLAWNVKTEIVKQMQKIGKKSHGYYLTLSLPVDQKGKRTQRRKEKFYIDFIKHTEKICQERYQLQEDNSGDDEESFKSAAQEEEKDVNREEDLQENVKKLNNTLKQVQDINLLDKIDLDDYINSNSSDKEDPSKTLKAHCETPNGEVLFLVGGEWLSYIKTSEACGRDALTDYIITNNVSKLHGKSTHMTREKITKFLQ